MAVLVVTGIDLEGKRDILAIEPMSTYTELFENLKVWGLEKVWIVVSEVHKVLIKAVRESFVGYACQLLQIVSWVDNASKFQRRIGDSGEYTSDFIFLELGF